MSDGRAPALPDEAGERLVRSEYKRDYRERYAAIRGGSSWKLERLQHFEEQNDPSRDALRRGDWSEALRLLEEDRPGLRTAQVRDAERASVFRRVRVVEEPLTPYVQWELHALRMSAEYGTNVRVCLAECVHASESEGLLPEVTILDERTLYRVLYTEAGVPDGAVRYTDPGVVSPWVAYVKGLYEAGEDIEPYYERAVAPLPPPPAA